MVFSYTNTGPKTDGSIVDYVENFDGNWRLETGTFIGGADANGDIVTGLTKIIFFGVTVNEIQNEAPKCSPNVTGAGAAEDGTIGILGMADATNNTGIWYAFGY